MKSLMRTTRYTNCTFWIGENGSTDGSKEFLDSFSCRCPVRIIPSDKPKLHSDWLDEVMRTVETPYWFAVDSDMLFLGGDPIAQMVSLLQKRPDLYLAACGSKPPAQGIVEPVNHRVIDTAEGPHTWLMCIRTSLRERLKASFAFHTDEPVPDSPNGSTRPLLYDTAGHLVQQMRAAGLGYAYMPAWFRCQYHHFGSLSWADRSNDSVYRAHKRDQISYIQRTVAAMQ